MTSKTTFIVLCVIFSNCYGPDSFINEPDGFIKGEPALAYWKIGSNSDVVIVLHGGPAAPHQYLRPEFDRLAEVAQVIYYDQRGCGMSQQSNDYHWQDHVEDLDRIICTFSKKKKVFLAGSSWGSTLAMLYTYKHPERVKGMILSGTYSWEGMGMTFVSYKKTHYPIKARTLKMQEHRLLLNQAKESIQRMVTVEKEYEKLDGPPSSETMKSMRTAPVLDSLRKITKPVLLFNGDNSNCDIDQAHVYVTIFPNAELCTIPAACHDPWFSDPEKFADRCAVFIRKVRKMPDRKR